MSSTVELTCISGHKLKILSRNVLKVYAYAKLFCFTLVLNTVVKDQNPCQFFNASYVSIGQILPFCLSFFMISHMIFRLRFFLRNGGQRSLFLALQPHQINFLLGLNRCVSKSILINRYDNTILLDFILWSFLYVWCASLLRQADLSVSKWYIEFTKSF